MAYTNKKKKPQQPGASGISAEDKKQKGRDLAGMTYSQGTDQLRPSELTAAGEKEDEVTGPMGRVFNRILGEGDNAKDTGDRFFDKSQLLQYLDQKLQLAESEWFRGKKLAGVSDKLFETLDTDTDDKIGWAEFQAFKAEVFKSIAPGVDSKSSPEEVTKAAETRFDELDNSDGSLNYKELHKGTKDALPEKTKHADLIAQLGARIALDAVDKDQRDQKVKDRTLKKSEWLEAAADLHQG